MSHRPLFVKRLRPGDVVVRRDRLLKTKGVVLRFDGEDENGASCAWIKWNHPNTLPNPSLEVVDSLELLGEGTPRSTELRPGLPTTTTSEDGRGAE